MTLLLFNGWTLRLNWKHTSSLVALVERIITPILVIGVVSLDFTLICCVGNYVDQSVVRHELRKRIYKRLCDEGIEFPVPEREVKVSPNPSNEIPFTTLRSGNCR